MGHNLLYTKSTSPTESTLPGDFLHPLVGEYTLGLLDMVDDQGLISWVDMSNQADTFEGVATFQVDEATSPLIEEFLNTPGRWLFDPTAYTGFFPFGPWVDYTGMTTPEEWELYLNEASMMPVVDIRGKVNRFEFKYFPVVGLVDHLPTQGPKPCDRSNWTLGGVLLPYPRDGWGLEKKVAQNGIQTNGLTSIRDWGVQDKGLLIEVTMVLSFGQIVDLFGLLHSNRGQVTMPMVVGAGVYPFGHRFPGTNHTVLLASNKIKYSHTGPNQFQTTISLQRR